MFTNIQGGYALDLILGVLLSYEKYNIIPSLTMVPNTAMR